MSEWPALDNLSDFLSHHGIKGQEWGVRRGPPYPLDRGGDVRIKKGTKFHSVMTKKKIKGGTDHDIYLYDPTDRHDTAVYKGAYAQQLLRTGRATKIYEHSFKTNEDLLLPSQKEKVDTFKKLYENDPAVRADIEDRKKRFAGTTFEEHWNNLDKNDATKLDRDYRLFVTVPNFQADDAHRKYIDLLKAKGYNAMFDDNDANQYMAAHNPLYVFSQKSLDHNKKSKVVTSQDYYKQWQVLAEDGKR